MSFICRMRPTKSMYRLRSDLLNRVYCFRSHWNVSYRCQRDANFWNDSMECPHNTQRSDIDDEPYLCREWLNLRWSNQIDLNAAHVAINGFLCRKTSPLLSHHSFVVPLVISLWKTTIKKNKWNTVFFVLSRLELTRVKILLQFLKQKKLSSEKKTRAR